MTLFFLAQTSLSNLTPEELADRPLLIFFGWFYLLLALAGVFVNLKLFSYWRSRRRGEPMDVAWLHRRAWDRRRLGILLAVLTGFFLLTSLIFRHILGDAFLEDERGQSIALVIQSITFHWAALGLVLLLLHRSGISLERAFGMRSHFFLSDLRVAVIGYVAVLPLLFVYGIAYQAAAKAFGFEPETQEVVKILLNSQSPLMLAYFAFLAVVVAPAIEEMLFRGVALPVLGRLIGIVPAVILISVIFALMHGQMSTVFPLFLLSTALCVAYFKTKSLTAPMLMHAIFNGVNVCFMLAGKV